MVQTELGTPVEAGWLVSGNIETSGGSGTTDLSIPLSGPEGSGTLFLEAEKSAGEWRFSYITLDLDEGGEIDLLQKD